MNHITWTERGIIGVKRQLAQSVEKLIRDRALDPATLVEAIDAMAGLISLHTGQDVTLSITAEGQEESVSLVKGVAS